MEHTDERCSAKLECNVPRPAADWQCCHEAGEAGEGAGSSDRRSPGAIVGGEKKNEVAWRILDVVGVKAGGQARCAGLLPRWFSGLFQERR